MPLISCQSVPDIPLMSCPELCGPACSGPHQYCDCGSARYTFFLFLFFLLFLSFIPFPLPPLPSLFFSFFPPLFFSLSKITDLIVFIRCMCTPGYSGDSCEVDVCESARCTAHGKCTARYLGGDLPPVRDVCVCDEPYAGPACETNPCAGRTCNGRGTCQVHGEKDSYCECQAGFSGTDCESSKYLSLPLCLSASLPLCLSASLPLCLSASLPLCLSPLFLSFTPFLSTPICF